MSPARKRVIARLSAAFILGALTTLAFAPFHIFPVGFIGFGGLLILMNRCERGGSAFWTGWFFGWGHFIAGLYWIASAFLVEPEKFAWMIPFPVLGLPALLAVFPAIAVLAAWRMAPVGPRRLLALAAAWTLMEMARGTVLTGFPWNLIGYAFGFHVYAMQPAAWVGIYGLSFLAVLLFALPALPVTHRSDRRTPAAVLGLIAIVFGATALRVAPNVADGGQFTVRIIQPNIAQRDKWRRDLLQDHFAANLQLSEGARDKARPDVVVWPETTATFLLANSPAELRALGDVAARLGQDGQGGVLITGAPRAEQGPDRAAFFNSAIAVDGSGAIVDTADKHHLVPFGEYLPLRGLLQMTGLEKLAVGRGDFSPGPANETLELPGLPDAAVLICYEAIFPSLARREMRPGWLLNLTNDGWFGNLTGPDQHFSISRFRAVEQGLPLVRAAGTGISAVIGPYGRIVERLPLGQRGAIQAQVPAPVPVTIFSQTGSVPLGAGLLLLMVAIGWVNRRKRPS
ncbi:apolipoprotein N-acyltransferase [Minwuia sp.]|uniref:apolipoprotein N-acyltransferase n=1 Tax=Minwuia sp. TaxID=2493630 RepID=UPI003A8D63F4